MEYMCKWRSMGSMGSISGDGHPMMMPRTGTGRSLRPSRHHDTGVHVKPLLCSLPVIARVQSMMERSCTTSHPVRAQRAFAMVIYDNGQSP
jgi:hypothetical protein